MHNFVPYVSIIIPTYNRKDLLKATIESVLNQSYSSDRYEVIIVDNESNDGTEAMVRALQSGAPCTLKYFRKNNEGPGVARNLAIKKAEGDIIAFTESDCIADFHWIENGVARMAEGVGLVQGKTLPNPYQKRGRFSHTQEIIRQNDIYQTCNMFYRKDVLEDVGGLSHDFIGRDRFGNLILMGEDTDLAWKVKKGGWKSTFAEDAVVYHHVFQLSSWESLLFMRRCQLFFYVWPLLVKKYPELRNRLFYHRFFITKRKAFFDLLILAMFLGIFMHEIFFLLAIPYPALLFEKFLKGYSLRTYHHRMILLLHSVIGDIIDFPLLVAGSLWHRSIVL